MLKLQIYSRKRTCLSRTNNKVIGYSTIFISLFCGRKSNRYNDIKCLKLEISRIDINLSNGFRFVRQNNSDQTDIPIYKRFIFFDMLPVDSTVRTAKVTGNN
jgi:hypothetical protein